MYAVFVLVKNLTSNSDVLEFSNFLFKEIKQGDNDALIKAQKLFSVGIPLYNDWVYERRYHYTPSEALDRIAIDIEDILFLLRLFKVGDLVFLHPCIQEPDGTMMRQSPYRVMSDIHPYREYELQLDECSHFDKFALELMSHKNWRATWFQTARRFFLYESSKEFNPTHNEVDRIVDYMIAMESILVPETDFVERRLRERAFSLINSNYICRSDTKSLLRDFYNVRSTIVHGGDISSKKAILRENIEFETTVRKVLIKAVKTLPEDDGNREAFLKRLFDICDQTRADKVYEDFCKIKDANEKKRCFDLISKRP